MLGILIEAIGIKPSGFSAGGLSLTFQRPEIIQGVIYLFCLFQAFRIFVTRTSRDYRPYLDLRRTVWETLPRKKKTLRHFPSRRDAIRLRWRAMIATGLIIDVAALILPVWFILFYNSAKVAAAVQAILTGAV
jgi:hypothetical protein